MDIEFYVEPHQRPNGDIPTFDMLESFDGDLKDYTLAQISKLDHRSKHSGLSIKKIENKLWCLRILHRKTYVRLFFTYLKDQKIVLLNGFVKKTNKIPSQELVFARKLLKEVHYA